MPARTGEEYITGLRERAAEVYICGEQVKDVTTHPAFRNGVRTLASLYDMQHDPTLRDAMTYMSPTTETGWGSLSLSRAPSRTGAAAYDDGPLGAGHLRHDGPEPGLYERERGVHGRYQRLSPRTARSSSRTSSSTTHIFGARSGPHPYPGEYTT
jgi:hypothetical protein